MDWISITTGCFAVSNAIAKTSLTLSRFVRDVRASRADLISLSAELHALDGVLDLLKDDAASSTFPEDLALQTAPVVAGSGAIVADIDALFDGNAPLASGAGSPGGDNKRAAWLRMKRRVEKARTALEVYRLTLGLALDLIALTSSADGPIPEEAEAGPSASASQDESALAADQTKDITRILAEIGHLRARVRGEFQENDTAFILQNYFNLLQRHAHIALEDAQKGDEGGAAAAAALQHDNAASLIGQAPDSAVELDEDSPFRLAAGKTTTTATTKRVGFFTPTSSYGSLRPPSPPRGDASLTLPMEELEDLIDEMRDRLPSRPPTPPPKASARGASALGFRPDHDRTNSGSSMVTISSAAAAPSVPRGPDRTFSLMSATDGRPFTSHEGAEHFGVPTSPTTSRNFPLGHSRSNSNISATMSTAGASTLNSGGSGGTVGGSGGGRRFGRFFRRHKRSASATTVEEQANKRPSTATTTGDSGSFASRRFSANIRPPFGMIGGAGHADDGDMAPFGKKSKFEMDSEPDAVFGVSLRKSIKMASSSARTHHTGSHAASVRAFPLCVFKCYNFLMEAARSGSGSDGIYAPGIFAGGGEDEESGMDGDGVMSGFSTVSEERVRQLRAIFAAAPTYGADLDLAHGDPLGRRGPYSAHDAAALVLLYLSELPRPLVSEAVAKRWITLSRQATVPGSYAKRLDQCIDFWEEALGGVRGQPARSLLKLLLNLWGDIADAADRNGMTAERLAAKVLQPLMHLDGAAYRTDYVLGLAFVIRKRSEYAQLLRGGGRRSKAAFET